MNDSFLFLRMKWDEKKGIVPYDSKISREQSVDRRGEGACKATSGRQCIMRENVWGIQGDGEV